MHYAKPLLRGWLHLLWFGASLVAGPLLATRGHGPWQVAALVVYAVSVSGLFGISALYHRGTWNPAWSARLQRLDHLMIFFLIAGTATPAFVLAAPGGDVGRQRHQAVILDGQIQVRAGQVVIP